MVDIGGRSLYLRCLGQGSPTVILEAGRFPSQSWDPVLRGVAETTHVCVYDRANRGASDPAPFPRSARDVVTDLHALLTAAKIPGPYVLVGGSMGGLFTRLFASTYPDEVAGMVLSDATYEELYTLQALVLSAEDNEATIQVDMEGGDEEGIWTEQALPITFEQVRQARLAGPMPPMPLVVLAAGRFDDDPNSPYPPASDAVWPTLSLLTQVAQATLTSDARYIVVPDSGHLIQEERPQAVVDAIADVVEAVRDPSTWSEVAASPAP